MKKLTPENLNEFLQVFERIVTAGEHTDKGQSNFWAQWDVGEFRRWYRNDATNAAVGGFFTDHAICVGLVIPTIFSKKYLFAEELICRSDGQDGMAVRDAFAEWARGLGAKRVFCENVSDCHNDGDVEWRDKAMQKHHFEPYSIRYCRRF